MLSQGALEHGEIVSVLTIVKSNAKDAGDWCKKTPCGSWRMRLFALPHAAISRIHVCWYYDIAYSISKPRPIHTSTYRTNLQLTNLQFTTVYYRTVSCDNKRHSAIIKSFITCRRVIVSKRSSLLFENDKHIILSKSLRPHSIIKVI